MTDETSLRVAPLKSDYDAGKPTRYQRTRSGLPPMGGSADYHLRNEYQFLKIIETARDCRRNDPIIARGINVATTNIVQNGFTLDPKTSNKKLDDAIAKRWKAWAESKDDCDIAGKENFRGFEQKACGGILTDGDFIALGLDSGHLQGFEAHQCRTPTFSKQKDKITLGVRLSKYRRHEGYYLVPESTTPSMPIKLEDAMYAPARATIGDRESLLQVFHAYFADRITQTRGVTCLAASLNTAGILDDTQLAALVQQQMAACAVIFRKQQINSNRPPAIPTAGATDEGIGGATYDSTTGRLEQQFRPGMLIHTPDGYEDTIANSNVPSPQYFEHVKLLVSIIAINIGVPYIVLMMDASETNFSGWRGAFEEAKKGFRVRQRNLVDTFHCPIYRWKLAQWIESGEFVVPKSVADPFGHVWTPPSWDYIEPLKDRTARRMSEKFGQTSPRRAAADVGLERWEVTDELIEDNEYVLDAAISAAERINAAHKDNPAPITWRDVLDPWEVPGTAFIAPQDPNNPDPYSQKPVKAPAKKQGAPA